MIFSADCLAGRRIMITGASSGLGRQAAIQLAQCGATLVLVGRSRDRLAEVLALLAGDRHRTVSADLSDADAADLMVKEAVTEGPLDGLFYSAGESVLAPMRMTKAKVIDQAFGAGLFGAIGVARAVSRKGALNDRASLVFMSSVAAIRGRQGMTAYSAAKAAIGGLVRSLAIEMAPRGIRVNAIAAGGVVTALHDDMAETLNDAMVERYRDLHLLGFGRPDDVGNAVVFLMSDAGRWITGQNLPIDGGYTAK